MSMEEALVDFVVVVVVAAVVDLRCRFFLGWMAAADAFVAAATRFLDVDVVFFTILLLLVTSYSYKINREHKKSKKYEGMKYEDVHTVQCGTWR